MICTSVTQTKQITDELRKLADAIDSGEVKLQRFRLDLDPSYIDVSTIADPCTIEGPYSGKLSIDFTNRT